jgi:hypothetical protein
MSGQFSDQELIIALKCENFFLLLCKRLSFINKIYDQQPEEQMPKRRKKPY